MRGSIAGNTTPARKAESDPAVGAAPFRPTPATYLHYVPPLRRCGRE
uniref:Uncharacterized protein n=1 Tax=Siphoviridae sp. ctxdc10 TaxID=2825740 RepID=A0A8S5TSL4_9CAUD|nr:MAG TPA: hypothetical protein [Siphoviridae sp. ctxdc10]DAU60151.1 MAG TPA: hypothetical protein [Caudoviricetes sp.]